MTILSLLTSADGSAGRDKADLRPIGSLAHQVASGEWNNVKNAVVELLAAIGLTDASTVDSVLQYLADHKSVRGSMFAHVEDFLAPQPGGSLSAIVTAATGTGVITFPAALAGEGAGLVKLATTAGAGTTSVRCTDYETLDFAANPECEFRFKTPADLTAIDFQIGLRNAAGTSKAMFGIDHTSTGKVFAASATGGGSGSTSGAALSAATWYRVRIVVTDNTSVAVYLDDVLYAEHTTGGTTFPRSGDKAHLWYTVTTRVGGADALIVDWIRTKGTRL